MATQSSILAWRIPWTEEFGGLQSTGHKESDTTERLHFHFTFTFIQLICYTFSLSYVEFKFMYSANRRMFWILTWFWCLPANVFSFNSSIFGSTIVLAVVCLIVQSLSHVWLFAAPWAAARQASLSFNISQSLLKPMSIESVMPSNHLILCCPLLLPPSVFPSIKVFSNESALWIRWPKYWNFNFSISPANEYSGLISFRIDWLDLLAVQGTLKSLLQHHSSKALILQRSAFSMIQLSYPYMTTRKTIALTLQTFVGNVMSLFFNTLSRFVIAFLPRSKSFIFMTAVTNHSDTGAQENKVCHVTVSIFCPSICHEVMQLDVSIFIFLMLSFRPAFSLSSFTFIKRLFSASTCSASRVVSSAYLRLLIFLLAVLIPACASSSLAFCVIYSA